MTPFVVKVGRATSVDVAVQGHPVQDVTDSQQVAQRLQAAIHAAEKRLADAPAEPRAK